MTLLLVIRFLEDTFVFLGIVLALLIRVFFDKNNTPFLNAFFGAFFATEVSKIVFKIFIYKLQSEELNQNWYWIAFFFTFNIHLCIWAWRVYSFFIGVLLQSLLTKKSISS